MKQTIILFSLLTSLIFFSCNSKTENTEPSHNQLSLSYSQIPREELAEENASAIYSELVTRYESEVLKLKKTCDAIGSKLIVINLSPECNENATRYHKKGNPILEKIYKSHDIQYIDMAPNFVGHTPQEITQMPADGHWSEKGASIVGNALAKILSPLQSYKSNSKENLTQKPETFGDLQPNQDEILDGGKNLPYRLVTNNTGLRMNTNLSFPKIKQHILLLGDSEFFFPFLDNEKTGSAVLQSLMPNSLIINAANWGYGLDDYNTLLNEKAKYTEPDIVVVATNAGDILDFYFTHRNKFSRTKKQQNPTENEKAFYNLFTSSK